MSKESERREMFEMAPPRLHGMAHLVRKAYAGESLQPIWETLLARANRNPADAAALHDLATILQTRQEHDMALEVLQAALSTTRTFEVTCGTGEGLTILVLMTPGDLMANTPIEFLLERSDARVILHYVDETTTSLHRLPAHDVAFLAVGESDAARPVLERLDVLLAGWAGPLVNAAPRRILALTRDGVSRMLADEPTVLAPPTVRVSRPLLESVVLGRTVLRDVLSGADWPITARPVGTHAGKGLKRLACAADLKAYLIEQNDAEMFYVSPFIEYANRDGLYRKQRIAFIDGSPYASHMAVSEHWMVHYLSAGMLRHAARRDEEARWMASFETDFARRHARALNALASKIGLDYFAIDCAELRDGRLLLFEADVAMIVHGMDSAETFPYKVEAMERIFRGFEAMLRAHSRPPQQAGSA